MPAHRRLAKNTRYLFSNILFWFVVCVIAIIVVISFHFGSNWLKPKWWAEAFAIATGFLASGITSFLFYYLVVYLPSKRRRKTIKENLRQIYKNIKRDILLQVVFASIKGGRRDLEASYDEIEKLMSPEVFATTFGKGREADEGFYAFQNQMHDNTPEFQEIVLNLEMLSKQIEHS